MEMEAGSRPAHHTAIHTHHAPRPHPRRLARMGKKSKKSREEIIAKRLAKYGVHDLRGVCGLDEGTLYREFGVNAEYLIDHAHGVEPCTIADIRAYEP